MYKHIRKSQVIIVLLIVLASLLSACGPETAVTQTAISETSAPFETQTPPTPTLSAPTVLLVISPDADPVTALQLQTTVETLAVESSLSLTVINSLTPDLLTENVKIVVGLGTGADLAALALTAPAIQFVAIDQPNAVPSTNLSVIGDPLVEEERQTFMGGYLAALVSSDYKVAGLIPSDIPLTTEAQNAYMTGARFYCGLCKSLYPPYNIYPQVFTMPVSNDSTVIQTAVANLVALEAEVVYVHGQLIAPELLNLLTDRGILIVGGESPDMARNNWVGTVAVDPSPALTRIWGDVVAGTGGQQVPGSIVLLDLESGLLSDGRRIMFDEMKTDLEENLVLPET